MDSYKVPVKNGSFDVELHFAETSGGITAAGKRIFDVDVEGQKFRDLDIFKLAGGANKAFVANSRIHVTDEVINIKFDRKTKCPMLNGIVIKSFGATSDPFAQLDKKLAEFLNSSSQSGSSNAGKSDAESSSETNGGRDIASEAPPVPQSKPDVSQPQSSSGSSASRSDPPYTKPIPLSCKVSSSGPEPSKNKNCCGAPSEKNYGTEGGINIAPKSESLPCSKRYGKKVISVDFDGYDGKDVAATLKNFGATEVAGGFEAMSIQKGMLCGNYKKGQKINDFRFFIPNRREGVDRSCVTSKMFIYEGFQHNGKMGWGGTVVGNLGCSAGGCPPPGQDGIYIRNVSASRSNGFVTRPYAYFLNRISSVWYQPDRRGANKNNSCAKMGAQGEDALVPQGKLVEFEMEVVLNDVGSTNGYIRYYIDGKQTAEMRNLMFRDKTHKDWTITHLMASEMWQGSADTNPKDQRWCYDEYKMLIPSGKSRLHSPLCSRGPHSGCERPCSSGLKDAPTQSKPNSWTSKSVCLFDTVEQFSSSLPPPVEFFLKKCFQMDLSGKEWC